MNKNMILVTKPLLPELNTLYRYLEDIWSSGWVTDMGSKHNELETESAAELDVPYFSLFNNIFLKKIEKKKK